MKKTALALIAVLCLAGIGFSELQGYIVYSQTDQAVSNATSEVTRRVDGQAKRVVIESTAGATCTVTIASTAGYGSALASGQTIYSGTITNDVATNLATTVYLWADRITCTVSNSWTNTVDCEILLIVDDEP